jgi:uncharacterized protein with NRDE domain
MCLIIFAHHASRAYPLLVAANRDEFHRRATAPSRFWPSDPTLLAGRDQQLGGTWMGVTRDGKFAAVTNSRDPQATREAPRSRGELPLDYLRGKQDPSLYLQAISDRAQEYAGFNLLLGDGSSMWYYSNNPQPSEPGQNRPRALEPGIYGLSNAQLDTPWPKVVRGKTQLKEMLDDARPIDHGGLFGLVNNADLADSGALSALGMGTEMEQLLSAQFICSETYGTRSSTTLWQDRGGIFSWREVSFDKHGEPTGTQQENFSQASAPPDGE